MCGIVGVYSQESSAALALDAMQWLQHRGEQGWGICAFGKEGMRVLRKEDLYKFHPLSDEQVSSLKGDIAVGHLRYATAGEVSVNNIQPLALDTKFGLLGLAHNGNLVNFIEMYNHLKSDGATFSAGADKVTDSEVILHRIARSSCRSLEDAVCDALGECKGAFSVVVAAQGTLIAARDPFGYRPLCIGKKDKSIAFASETCALDMVDMGYEREVQPGEMCIIEDGTMRSRFVAEGVQPRQCVFEYVYFANPASRVFGRWVNDVRVEMGRELAREAPCDADIVIPVPDSGKCAALGYAQELGMPYAEGMVRSHYARRSFIQKGDARRAMAVRSKLLPSPGVVQGKRVIVVEDSVVRGTTTRLKMQGLYDAGAKEVHLRVASPPIMHPCYMGIDFPSKRELLVNNVAVEKVAQHLGIDSCVYLSKERMLQAIARISREDAQRQGGDSGFCTACFDGDYPSGVPRYVQVGRCS